MIFAKNTIVVVASVDVIRKLSPHYHLKNKVMEHEQRTEETCPYCGATISVRLMSVSAYKRHYEATCQEDGRMEIIAFLSPDPLPSSTEE